MLTVACVIVLLVIVLVWLEVFSVANAAMTAALLSMLFFLGYWLVRTCGL